MPRHASSPPAPLPPSPSMRAKFAREVASLGLPAVPRERQLVTDADLASLPIAAQRMMRFSGTVGRFRDASFCAHYDAQFRLSPDAAFQPVEIWQYDTSMDVARVFHMRMNLGGVVPTYIRDLYAHGGGHMLGKVLDVLPIVDDETEKVTVGELVTYVNDAVLFAPSMLLGPAVSWAHVDDATFEVMLTDRHTTVSARVFLDAHGAVTDFMTTDRFGTDPANPKAGLVRTEWRTPVDGWTLVDNRPRPVGARAVWRFPSGDFTYASFDLRAGEIAYHGSPGELPGAAT